ncbi:hypothetical protein [Nocardia concava]|uniref:hypothetical protein n=1 Tax=Nocardia concava TaxID=257281 RepID=UPI0003168DB4|nr:hypothetical protein [Nocardia concava]
MLTALPHAVLGSGHECAPSPLLALLTELTLACLVCAWHLWNRPTVRAWILGAGMNLVMLTGHVILIRTGQHPNPPAALLAWAAVGSGLELAVAIAAIRVRGSG